MSLTLVLETSAPSGASVPMMCDWLRRTSRCVSSRGFEQKEHRKLGSLSIGGAHAF